MSNEIKPYEHDTASESSQTIDADEVVQIDTKDRGPWAILLSSAAGMFGLLLHYSFGSGTASGYVMSFAAFAGLMWLALWSAQRAKEQD